MLFYWYFHKVPAGLRRRYGSVRNMVLSLEVLRFLAMNGLMETQALPLCEKR
jgi:hypothetical protein